MRLHFVVVFYDISYRGGVKKCARDVGGVRIVRSVHLIHKYGGTST
jgi:hypothetical protein